MPQRRLELDDKEAQNPEQAPEQESDYLIPDDLLPDE